MHEKITWIPVALQSSLNTNRSSQQTTNTRRTEIQQFRRYRLQMFWMSRDISLHVTGEGVTCNLKIQSHMIWVVKFSRLHVRLCHVRGGGGRKPDSHTSLNSLAPTASVKTIDEICIEMTQKDKKCHLNLPRGRQPMMYQQLFPPSTPKLELLLW